MFKLKVNEVIDFEELSGVRYAALGKAAQPKLCKPHRLSIGACAACTAAVGFCAEHLAAFNECDDCTGADLPMRPMMAIAYLLKRRNEPDLTWDQFAESTDVDEAAELLNA